MCFERKWSFLFVGLVFVDVVVSAVRLMRIELGGAFADLLNEKGKGSGENEMGYVQRTLGFRTRELSHHDLRLVSNLVSCYLEPFESFLCFASQLKLQNVLSYV